MATLSTILALGYLDAPSSDVTVADGTSVNVGAFTTSGAYPSGLQMPVMIDTPGADTLLDFITSSNRAVSVPGPCTFRVLRPLIDATIPVGVFLVSA
jgi:hypothetical protein